MKEGPGRGFRKPLALGLGLVALGAALLGLALYNYWGPSSQESAFEAAAGESALFPGPQSDTADASGVDATPAGAPAPSGTATTPSLEASPTPAPASRPAGPAASFAGSLVIEAIGIEAPVIVLGVDGNGVPQVPRTGYQVAWYDFSAAPGTGSNAVFAGHVTWEKKAAVFWRLKDLKDGDTVKLVNADGSVLVYKVFASFAVDPTDVKVMYPTGEDIVTLIT